MIPVLFPQQVSIGTGEGGQCAFAGYDPERLRQGAVDPERIYLLMDELLANISKECRKHGVTEPVALDAGVFGNLPAPPASLPELLAQPDRFADRTEIRICLINGGGGGYGAAQRHMHVLQPRIVVSGGKGGAPPLKSASPTAEWIR